MDIHSLGMARGTEFWESGCETWWIGSQVLTVPSILSGGSSPVVSLVPLATLPSTLKAPAGTSLTALAHRPPSQDPQGAIIVTTNP